LRTRRTQRSQQSAVTDYRCTGILRNILSRLLLEGHWLGLSYLLLDHGYPFHGAIQDALELGEFRLVLTLLSKINPSENHVLQRLDTKQRNLPLAFVRTCKV